MATTVDERSAVSRSKEFSSFRTSVTRRRQLVHVHGKEYKWRLYDHGPRTVRCPLLFLPPVSGTAEVWFQQMLSLGCQGFRCVAVDYPPVDSVEELIPALLRLLAELGIQHVRLHPLEGARRGERIDKKAR